MKRIFAFVFFAFFFFTANLSPRETEVHAEVREAYLFAVSGPIIAMIIGIIVTGALTEHDPKIQEIKATSSTSLPPQIRDEIDGLQAMGIRAQNLSASVSGPSLRGTFQHPSPLCNRCPQP